MPSIATDRSLIDFFRNGGVVYSGPSENSPTFWKGHQLQVSIRQSFYMLCGDRATGFGNAAFKRAKQLRLIRPIVQLPWEFNRGNATVEGNATWFVYNEGFAA